jgi:class 3 adenylate cyclase
MIGKRKFIYDLWGDAVTTASRMEANGLENLIQTTEAVRQKLMDKQVFEQREPIFVKGKGEMVTYWLHPQGVEG